MEFRSFDNKTEFYSFYYDESGNTRKFYIQPDKNRFNIDGDPNQKARYNFALGGIAHKGESASAEPMELILNLKLQKTTKELKLDQIARGNFSDILKSSKLAIVLKWIFDSDCYIHYFNLNMVYWAFIDIVDDCLIFCADGIKVPVKSEADAKDFVNDLKSSLYDAIKHDMEKFLKLLSSFNYPAVEGEEPNFIAAILDFVKDYRAQLVVRGFSKFSGTVLSCDGLIHVLELCESIDEMILTQDDAEDLIIDGLYMFYQYRTTHFKNSIHVFDEETEVQKGLEENGILKEEFSVKQISFVDSEVSPFIQISDVIVGLFGKYFDFLDSHSTTELLEERLHFNQQQINNMELIRKLIEKSDDQCPEFLHYVMSSGEHRKHKEFMFPGVE